MNLYEYFQKTEGTGVLATADSDGNVNIAIYARPHVTDEQTVAFIMNERLSYKNTTSNPKAAYLFLEDNYEYKGKRLYLNKIKEENDEKLIDSMRRKHHSKHHDTDPKTHLVYFEVEKVRALVGE